MTPSDRLGDSKDVVLENFFERLGHARDRVLLLDYDGTLAPFHVDRDAAVPYPGVREALRNIMETNTRLVLISGRWIKDLIPLLALKHVPEIWGSHGWERVMPDGHYHIAQPDARALEGLAEADTWSEEIIALGGRIEQKPACLAIHWRGLDPKSVEQIRAKVIENWTLVARQTGLKVYTFDGGLELRVPGRNKGYAVGTILRETGNDPAVAYLGDDFTDEDAFRALKGKGLCVLVRADLRPTLADLWLRPPDELLEFLRRWTEIAGEKQ